MINNVIKKKKENWIRQAIVWTAIPVKTGVVILTMLSPAQLHYLERKGWR